MQQPPPPWTRKMTFSALHTLVVLATIHTFSFSFITQELTAREREGRGEVGQKPYGFIDFSGLEWKLTPLVHPFGVVCFCFQFQSLPSYLNAGDAFNYEVNLREFLVCRTLNNTTLMHVRLFFFTFVLFPWGYEKECNTPRETGLTLLLWIVFFSLLLRFFLCSVEPFWTF